MGKKILDTTIKVGKIIIDKDAGDDYGTERLLNEWGKSIPVIQIGDENSVDRYVINSGDLISFELKISINNLPKFTMSINDEDYIIRQSLKEDVDKCVIFLGYKDWYIKFNGLIEKNYSGAGDKFIDLEGVLYVPELYNQIQKAYNNQSVLDILKDVCKTTKLGLYIIDNPDLQKTINYTVASKRYFDILNDFIQTKTTNIYCFDPFGYLHIGDIDKIRKEPLSKYTLVPLTGQSIPATNIIFTSDRPNQRKDDGTEDVFDSNVADLRIPVKYYTLSSNFSKTLTNSYKEYGVYYTDDKKQSLINDRNLLKGDKWNNTFHGFKDSNFPFYSDVVNKLLNGNLITTEIEHLLFELSPFDMVEFQAYLPNTGDKGFRKDEEHSGKKMVIGYSIIYERTKREFNKLTQVINLI